MFELGSVDLESCGFDVATVEVGRGEALTSQEPDLLAQYVAGGG